MSASVRTLVKRAYYGGRKGRRAWLRLMDTTLGDLIEADVLRFEGDDVPAYPYLLFAKQRVQP